MASPDDQIVIDMLKQGREEALSHLYDQYGVSVYSLAYRILNTRESAEEITQDVFMTIWKQPHRWNPERGKLQTYLLTITRNRSIDRLRREARTTPMEHTLIDELPHPKRVSDTHRIVRWENGNLLRDLIHRLPHQQADVIEQAYLHGKTLRSIAEADDIPLSTIKSRLRTGLQTLRQLWLMETQTDRPTMPERNRD